MTFLVVQDGVTGSLIIGHLRLPEPHVVDVHVGGAHPELADVRVQGKLLIPCAIFDKMTIIFIPSTSSGT